MLVLWLIEIEHGGVWARLEKTLSVRVYANGPFYFLFAFALFINLIVAWVITRFHYWVVDHNEIIIHNGFMHEQERHPTSTARFRLQVDDVIEYALFARARWCSLSRTISRSGCCLPCCGCAGRPAPGCAAWPCGGHRAVVERKGAASGRSLRTTVL